MMETEMITVIMHVYMGVDCRESCEEFLAVSLDGRVIPGELVGVSVLHGLVRTLKTLKLLLKNS